nr:unnamed protein product [Digitaria exilis]
MPGVLQISRVTTRPPNRRRRRRRHRVPLPIAIVAIDASPRASSVPSPLPPSSSPPSTPPLRHCLPRRRRRFPPPRRRRLFPLRRRIPVVVAVTTSHLRWGLTMPLQPRHRPWRPPHRDNLLRTLKRFKEAGGDIAPGIGGGRRVRQEVGRLEVAVDHAVPVQEDERGAHLGGDGHGRSTTSTPATADRRGGASGGGEGAAAGEEEEAWPPAWGGRTAASGAPDTADRRGEEHGVDRAVGSGYRLAQQRTPRSRPSTTDSARWTGETAPHHGAWAWLEQQIHRFLPLDPPPPPPWFRFLADGFRQGFGISRILVENRGALSKRSRNDGEILAELLRSYLFSLAAMRLWLGFG